MQLYIFESLTQTLSTLVPLFRMSKNEDPYFVTSGSPYPYDGEIETENLFDTGATLYIEKKARYR